ncbi:class I SAM-dependent methyltransferase [Cyanobium sp. NIES-981]|uniref:class I SAM-dependent methyltransferase n=1 Tax=Cyanobium sp. NIES-981 TaxID=1851505 RepID=UPI0007DD555D|nr:class I SAM-dependent methyltransferase [Cyanobium sp. NIES-981]SBO43363.1 Methylase involved in ubiquinone/menaquinone biosynthesis [Cyanobium sp. NIES-981]
MRFSRILSFGRTGEELLRILALQPATLNGLRVLDCPGGPGSLSSSLRCHGALPTAVDPAYALPREHLEAQTLRDIQAVADQLDDDPIFRDDFDKTSYLASKRQAYRQFLDDRQAHPGDYIAAALPDLPFADQSFDLVVSCSLLFSYAPAADGGLLEGPGLDLAWHRSALRELMRVTASEIRVYPAHTQFGAEAVIHPFVEPLLTSLQPGWTARLFHAGCHQGLRGDTVGLVFQRARK